MRGMLRPRPMPTDRSPEPPSPPPPMPTLQVDPRMSPTLPVRPGPGDDPRLAPLVEDVARRLRTVCAGMAPAAFDALVLDIARFHLRWEDRGG